MHRKPTTAEMAAAAKRVQELVAEYRAWKPEKWGRPRGNADYQIGDILRVSCAPATAQVVHVSPYHVSIAWPWGAIDPDSKYRWNGQVAFPFDVDSWEWLWWLFRTEPAPHQLSVGDICAVYIPETYVAVLDIIEHDPPADTGRLPRPNTTLVVRLLDHLEPSFGDDDEEDSGIGIELGAATPIALEVVFREE